jgi:hypothetical protein
MNVQCQGALRPVTWTKAQGKLMIFVAGPMHLQRHKKDLRREAVLFRQAEWRGSSKDRDVGAEMVVWWVHASMAMSTQYQC